MSNVKEKFKEFVDGFVTNIDGKWVINRSDVREVENIWLGWRRGDDTGYRQFLDVIFKDRDVWIVADDRDGKMWQYWDGKKYDWYRNPNERETVFILRDPITKEEIGETKEVDEYCKYLELKKKYSGKGLSALKKYGDEYNKQYIEDFSGRIYTEE